MSAKNICFGLKPFFIIKDTHVKVSLLQPPSQFRKRNILLLVSTVLSFLTWCYRYHQFLLSQGEICYFTCALSTFITLYSREESPSPDIMSALCWTATKSHTLDFCYFVFTTPQLPEIWRMEKTPPRNINAHSGAVWRKVLIVNYSLNPFSYSAIRNIWTQDHHIVQALIFSAVKPRHWEWEVYSVWFKF